MTSAGTFGGTSCYRWLQGERGHKGRAGTHRVYGSHRVTHTYRVYRSHRVTHTYRVYGFTQALSVEPACKESHT